MSEQVWVIRAGEKARYADEFLDRGVIAVDFREMGMDDLGVVGEERLKARAVDGTTRHAVGQLAAFAYRMAVGDLVIVPRLPRRRDYLVGRVTGPYRFLASDPVPGPHQRAVSWLGTFQRDDLSKSAVNTMGSVVTLFRPTAVEAELRSILTNPDPLTRTTPPAIETPSDPAADKVNRQALDLPPLRFDVATDPRGTARIVCDHPALVMEQAPRSVDPSSDWAGVPGVYVLTGTDLQSSAVRTGVERTLTTTMIVRPWAYVGLSEDFLGRLASHRQSKPEWRRSLVVRSGATPFTSDDIKYLELRVHTLLAATEEVLMPQSTPRGNLSAQPRNPPLLDACGDAVVSVLRLTGTLI